MIRLQAALLELPELIGETGGWPWIVGGAW